MPDGAPLFIGRNDCDFAQLAHLTSKGIDAGSINAIVVGNKDAEAFM